MSILYKIKNNYGNYLFLSETNIAFSSKENATTMSGVEANEWLKKLRTFYGRKTKFESEKI